MNLFVKVRPQATGMTMTGRVVRALALMVLLLSGPAGLPPLHGQVVPVKTVPVASGDQFLLFPSENLAMAGISLALPDTLGGGFVNPALATRLPESFAFGSPTYYGISGDGGSGRALPLGTLFRSGHWVGGGAVAIQELKGAEQEGWPEWDWFSRRPQVLSEGSSRNLYAFGLLGRRFPELGLTMGFSGLWGDLNALQGVDLLYAGSEGIVQSGNLSDLRFGLTKDWAGSRTLELLVLKSRFRMRHEVTYLDWIWTPGAPGGETQGTWMRREEVNLDHTDTWGVHLAYRRPLEAAGWRVAWSLTGNWKDHPKIPNYEIQNIPRDPGDTRAFSAGMGISRAEDPLRVAVEAFLEPIRSHTWAEAGSDTLSVDGSFLPKGAKTVDNEFEFTNVRVQMGASWRFSKATIRGGIQLRSISYDLDQYNFIETRRRTQEESWVEWTPSLGASLDLQGARLQYALLVTTGTGRPGVAWPPESLAVPTLDSGSNFLLAPQGALTLQEARVATHQLSVVIPIR